MAADVELENPLADKFAAVLPHLDERSRRLVLGAEARMLGHGGIRRVDGIAGVQTQIVLDALANASGAPLLIAQDSAHLGASG